MAAALLQLGWGAVEDDAAEGEDQSLHVNNNNLLEPFHIDLQEQYDDLEVSEWTLVMRKWWRKHLQEKSLTETIRALVRCHNISEDDYFKTDCYATLSQQSLSKYFESGEHSDLIITTTSEGMNYNVHLAVLEAHTDFFTVCLKDCWRNDSRESNGNTVTLDCDPNILLLLLRYFYFGEIDRMPNDSLISCLTLSHQFMCHSLTSLLEIRIASHIDTENVCSILNLAELLDLPFLKEKCLILALKDLQNVQRLEYFHDLPSTAQSALRDLRRSYEQSKSLYGDTFHYIRELLSMIKDAIDEGEEVYKISKIRNMEEIEQCDEKLRRRNIVDPFSVTLVIEYDYDKSIIEWRRRLEFVEESLRHQREQLDKRQEFYQQQKRALDVFYGSS
jgi:hypothetical protein